MNDGNTMPGWPLLLRRELAALFLGVSPSTFDALAKTGRLPRPVKITASLKAWHRQDLEAWAEDLRAGDANPWDDR